MIRYDIDSHTQLYDFADTLEKFYDTIRFDTGAYRSMNRYYDIKYLF